MLKKTITSLTVLLGLAFFCKAQGDPTLSYTSNQPTGTAKGIFPGRVVWDRNPEVCKWDGTSNKWWEEGNIDQKILDRMFDESLQALTGAGNNKKAWKKVFKYYNNTHGRGNKGYDKSEAIVIKINLNNATRPNDTDNEIDQSVECTKSILRHLVKFAGVPQERITIYDASRVIPQRLYNPVHSEYPGVRFMCGRGGEGVEAAEWVENAISYTDPNVRLGTSLPKAVVEADYLVNVALLKGHEITGVTLGAKNHFGSIQFPSRQHNSNTVQQYLGKPGDYSALVDLLGSPVLGGKTVLSVVDGLYGMQTNVGEPKPDRDKWKKLFNGEWSSSLFMSLDPVAIECVCTDFLVAEFGEWLGFSGAPAFPKGSSVNCDNYLKEAAKGVNDGFGPYKPNGVRIGSLGVFEHWNDPVNKQYSRNLGRNDGIELFTIGVDNQ